MSILQEGDKQICANENGMLSVERCDHEGYLSLLGLYPNYERAKEAHPDAKPSDRLVWLWENS